MTGVAISARRLSRDRITFAHPVPTLRDFFTSLPIPNELAIGWILDIQSFIKTLNASL